MINELVKIFEDEMTVERIRKKLPYMFHLAELEISRGGKAGMDMRKALYKYRKPWKKTIFTSSCLYNSGYT